MSDAKEEVTERPAADIHAAKLRIMAELGYVRKTGKVKNKTGGMLYTFAGEKDLLRAVRPLLIEQGVTVTPVEVRPIPGTPAHLMRAVYRYRFYHAASGSEDFAEVLGEGGDQGDKACPKANTIGLKYALRLWLQLETGDDPDATPSEKISLDASFEKCKEALLAATSIPVLDKYRWAYKLRPYSDEQLAALDSLYQERHNSLGGRRRERQHDA